MAIGEELENIPLTPEGEVDEDKLYGAGGDDGAGDDDAREGDAPAADVGAEGDGEPEGDAGKPADKQPDEPEDDPARKDDRVPLATYLELRNELKQQQQRQAQLERLTQAMIQKYGQQPQQQQQPEEEEVPEYLEDPKGYVDHQIAQLKKLGEQLQGATQQQQTAAQQQQMIQQVIATSQAYETRFVQQNPDYEDALNHFRRVEMARLQAAGVPEQAIGQQVQIGEVALAARMLQNGQDPAAGFYQLAQAAGYAPKAQQQQNQQQNQQQRRNPADAQSMGDGGSRGGEDLQRLYNQAGTDTFDEAFNETFGKAR